MSSPFATFVQARLMATGSALDVDAPNLSPRCATEADFDSLVSNYYKFLNEKLSVDVSYLTRVVPSRRVEEVRRLVYNLRTAAQHTDNERAVQAVRHWRALHPSPQAAADGLADALNRGLRALGEIALRIARDSAQSSEWRDAVAIETDTVFATVAADLGLTFSYAKQRWMVRQVDQRLKVDPGKGDRRGLVAEYCVQQLVSTHRPLPVPYDQVLDALGLLGAPGASGGVLVAHSVAEISPSLRGEEFVARVLEAWRAAAAY